MSRHEIQLWVGEWGEPATVKAHQMVRDLPLGVWLDVAYGYDKACGYFLQVKPVGVDVWTVDYDSLFDGLNGGELLHLFGVMRLPVSGAVVAGLAGDLAI